MPKKQNLIGKKFTRWTVVKEVKVGKNATRWLCKCDCGNYGVHKTGDLNSGNTKSCGCLQRDRSSESSKTHGLRNTKLYGIWNTMKFRCYNKNSSRYNNYGGRGITICDEWKNNFISFYNWAMSNGYKEGLSIDRINNDGNYEPSNCRWTNLFVQANNTRRNIFITYNRETHSASEWSKLSGVPINTIIWRYRKYGICDKVFYRGNLRSLSSGMLYIANQQRNNL